MSLCSDLLPDEEDAEDLDLALYAVVGRLATSPHITAAPTVELHLYSIRQRQKLSRGQKLAQIYTVCKNKLLLLRFGSCINKIPELR
jgi:hypothetical protein